MKRDGGRSVGGSLHPVKLARVAACLRALWGLGQAPSHGPWPARVAAVAEGPGCLLPYAPADPLGVVVWLYAPHAEAATRLGHEAQWFGLDARSVVALAVPPGALRARLAAALGAPGVLVVVLDGRLGLGGPQGPALSGQVASVLQAQARVDGPQLVLLRAG